MKSFLSATELALALVTGSIPAKASSCNNATIQGSYAFTIRGRVFLPVGSHSNFDGLAKPTV